MAGHRGLVGSALLQLLEKEGYSKIFVAPREKVDLLDGAIVHRYFEECQFEYVFICAGTVGGIQANSSFPFDFIYNNAMIACNTIHAAAKSKVKKLLYLGSSCIYPKFATQPIQEKSLLAGRLEKTNEAYAIAKILGVKLCETYSKQYDKNFISVMPTNLYGNNDNFDLMDSHVIPGMMRKFHIATKNSASSLSLWGTGNAQREFLHVRDAAAGIYKCMLKYNDTSEPINLGYGQDISIKSLANLMSTIVGYKGNILFNSEVPDGTPQKLLDSSKILSLGWKPAISLEAGLREVYRYASKNGKLD